jgi:hypothetical protein
MVFQDKGALGMASRQTWGTAFAALLTVAATACGAPTPAGTPAELCPPAPATPTPSASPKTVKQTKKPSATGSAKPATGKPGPKASSPAKGDDTAPDTDTPAPKADDAQTLFSAMQDKVGAAGSYTAIVRTIDNNKYKVKQTKSTMKISFKAPGSHRIDIQETTNALTKGGKMVFRIGQPNAKLRPGGILGVALMDMALSDTTITTGCEWRLDQVVAVGLTTRFAEGYTATMAGQTTIGGETVKVLKVVADGTNSLDGDIDYEHVGIDGDNMLRYWAVYAKPGINVPNGLMWQMTMDSVQMNAPVADSTFTI